jgi:hypothetical protein
VNAGGRVGVEPEVDVVLTDRVRLAVFGGVSFGAGVALIEIDSGSDTEEFDTEASTFGIEAGVRLTLAKFLFSVAYVHRETTYDRSDPGSLGGNAVSVFGNAVNETDFEFDGVMLTAGFRW